jgi:hypothetical protein
VGQGRVRSEQIALTIPFFSLPVPQGLGDEGAHKTRGKLFAVRLLPGYKTQWVSGIEGDAGGTIWKDGGPKIEVVLDMYSEDPTQTVNARECYGKKSRS